MQTKFMNMTITNAVTVCVVLLPVFASFGVSVVTHDPADPRAWSVMPDANDPLVWAWDDGATAATLFASNLLTGALSVTPVERLPDALDGSVWLPAVTGEGVFGVTLVQSAGGEELSSSTVTLKCGSATRLFGLKNRAFSKLDGPRIFGWDDAWAGVTASSAEFKGECQGTEVSRDLGAIGGYGVIRSEELPSSNGEPIAVRVVFDGNEASALLALLRITTGLTIMLR